MTEAARIYVVPKGTQYNTSVVHLFGSWRPLANDRCLVFDDCTEADHCLTDLMDGLDREEIGKKYNHRWRRTAWGSGEKTKRHHYVTQLPPPGCVCVAVAWLRHRAMRLDGKVGYVMSMSPRIPVARWVDPPYNTDVNGSAHLRYSWQLYNWNSLPPLSDFAAQTGQAIRLAALSRIG